MKISGQQQVGFGMNLTIHPDLTYHMPVEVIEKIGAHCESIKDIYPDVFVRFEPSTLFPGRSFDVNCKKITPDETIKTDLYNFKRLDLDRNPIPTITTILDRLIKTLGLDKNAVLTRYIDFFK